MQGCDRETINRTIYEMSKNSTFFKHAQKVDAKVGGIRFRRCT
jgi:hypothetical protein